MTTSNGIPSGRKPSRGNGRVPSYHGTASPVGRTVFTSGQVAAMLGVAPRTVSKWHAKGLFPDAYRMPGSTDRRFPLAGVVAFARAHGIPMGHSRQVLLCGITGHLADTLRLAMPEAVLVDSLFALGRRLDGAAPAHVIVLDLSLGRGECLRTALEIRQELPACRLIGLLPDDARLTVLDGFDCVMLASGGVRAIVEGIS